MTDGNTQVGNRTAAHDGVQNVFMHKKFNALDVIDFFMCGHLVWWTPQTSSIIFHKV